MRGKKLSSQSGTSRSHAIVYYSKNNEFIQLLKHEKSEKKLHGNCKHITSRGKKKTPEIEQSMQRRKTTEQEEIPHNIML